MHQIIGDTYFSFLIFLCNYKKLIYKFVKIYIFLLQKTYFKNLNKKGKKRLPAFSPKKSYVKKF